jgi:hypothetical protein
MGDSSKSKDGAEPAPVNVEAIDSNADDVDALWDGPSAQQTEATARQDVPLDLIQAAKEPAESSQQGVSAVRPTTSAEEQGADSGPVAGEPAILSLVDVGEAPPSVWRAPDSMVNAIRKRRASMPPPGSSPSAPAALPVLGEVEVDDEAETLFRNVQRAPPRSTTSDEPEEHPSEPRLQSPASRQSGEGRWHPIEVVLVSFVASFLATTILTVVVWAALWWL